MVNLKITAGGAVTGLIISIISGLIGGVGFATLLIRALVCAVVCGGIAAGAYYVFQKYLYVEDGMASPAETVQRPVVTGTTVNISVGDDPLPDTEGAPEFFVTNSDDAKRPPEPVRQTKPAETVPPAEPAVPASAPVREAPSGFVPASLGSMTSPQTVKAQASGPDSTHAAPAAGSGAPDMFGGLDVMPEFEEIVSSVDEPHDPGPMESEETSFTELKGNDSEPLSEVNVGSDAETMAKAIRTLLNSEG